MLELPSDVPAVERGVGFFETMWVIGRRVSLFDEHVARLRAAMTRLALPFPSAEQLLSDVQRALEERPVGSNDEAALRLTWLAVGADLELPRSWQLTVSLRAIPAATLQRRAGAHAVTLPREFQRDMPAFKSTSYLAGVLGLRWAHKRRGNEGLFVGQDGQYLEGSSTGLLAWNEGKLVRPKGPQLSSVTRQAFLNYVKQDAGTAERPLEAAELRAGGAILFGALTRAVPLLTLDEQPCAQPPEMLEAVNAFNQHLEAQASELRSPGEN